MPNLLHHALEIPLATWGEGERIRADRHIRTMTPA